MFDRLGFYNQAKQKGKSDQEINSFLLKKGEAPVISSELNQPDQQTNQQTNQQGENILQKVLGFLFPESKKLVESAPGLISRPPATNLQESLTGNVETAKKTLPAAGEIASWLLPVGAVGKGGMSLAKAAGASALISGATSSEPSSLLERVSTLPLKVGAATAFGKGAEKVGKIAGAPLKMVKENVSSALDTVNTKVGEVLDNALGTLVGRRNVDFAKAKGLVVLNDTPEIVLKKVEEYATSLEGQLDDILTEAKLIPYGEPIKVLKQMIKDVPPSPTMTKKREQYVKELSNWFENQVLKVTPGSTEYVDPNAIFQGTKEVSLKTLNEVKRRLGELYDTDKVFKKMYNYLRGYIEDKADNPMVHKINQKLQKLIDIKEFARTSSGKATLPAEILSPEKVAKEVSQQSVSNPVLGAISALPAVAGYLFGGPLLGAGGGYASYRLLQNLVKSPSALKAVQKGIGKIEGVGNNEIVQAVKILTTLLGSKELNKKLVPSTKNK